MKRRAFIAALGGAAAWPLMARAQQNDKVYSVAFFSAGSAMPLDFVFPDALRELGWIEGKNIIIDPQYAENQINRLPELAAQLVQRNVDVIVAVGTLAPLAAKQATTTIPIVMAAADDPLGNGLVVSLAHPGENVTGLSLVSADISAKRLELLRELLPRISRVAVLWNSTNPHSARVFEETERAAQLLGIDIQSVGVKGPDELDRAFEAIGSQRPDALITAEDPLIANRGQEIAWFTTKLRLPTMHEVRDFVLAGGLMSYGPQIPDLIRRAAGYVDKILMGEKPGDLPVEQPTKFDLIVNLKTANVFGQEILQALLAHADEVVQ